MLEPTATPSPPADDDVEGLGLELMVDEDISQRRLDPMTDDDVAALSVADEEVGSEATRDLMTGNDVAGG